MIVYAHRGASSRKPENTKEAFEEAIRLKSVAFETDIHRTKDKQYVLCHDDSVHIGLNKRRHIVDMNRKELEQMGFLFLEEFLELFEPHMRVNIEIKDIGSTEHIHEVMEYLQAYRHLDIIISSFDHSYVYGMRDIDVTGQMDYALLFDKGQIQDVMGSLAGLGGIEWVHIANRDAEEDTIRCLHNKGLKVGVYTVDDLHRIKELKSWGVDGVFTNHADYAEVIKNWKF